MKTPEALERAGAPPSGGGGGGGVARRLPFVITVAVVLGVGYLLLRPTLQRARDGARRAQSMSNLVQIGVALAMYSQEHDDALPRALDELVETGHVTDPTILVSPRTGAAYTYIRPPEGVAFASENADEVAVAYDRGADRKGEGGFVLFLDGRVRWYSGPDPVASARRAAERARKRAAAHPAQPRAER